MVHSESILIDNVVEGNAAPATNSNLRDAADLASIKPFANGGIVNNDRSNGTGINNGISKAFMKPPTNVNYARKKLSRPQVNHLQLDCLRAI